MVPFNRAMVTKPPSFYLPLGETLLMQVEKSKVG